MKVTLANDKISVEKPSRKPWWHAKLLPVIGWVLWLTFAFFAANVVMAIILVALRYAHLTDLRLGTVAMTFVDAGLYVMMFAIAIWLPLRQRKKARKLAVTDTEAIKLPRTKFILNLLGLSRWPNWRDVGYFASNVPLFYLTDIVAMFAATLIFGLSTMSQQQNLGFAMSGQSAWHLVAIFIALVIIPPLVEEALMRGFLFGKLREKIPFWPAALVVSLLFAVAHWQINVSLMTFILSMFNCRIREKTGSIWGGVFMHMTVNLLSFGVLFLGWFGGANVGV